MRCQGGKSRVADELAAVLEEVARAAGVAEIEDRFCGSMAVADAVQRRRGPLVPVLAEDGCRALITTYKAVASGWEPPTRITREQYAELQAAQDHGDPLTAIAGVFCSHGGKWFAGYVADDERWPGETARVAAAQARACLLRRAAVRPACVLAPRRGAAVHARAQPGPQGAAGLASRDDAARARVKRGRGLVHRDPRTGSTRADEAPPFYRSAATRTSLRRPSVSRVRPNLARASAIRVPSRMPSGSSWRSL